MPSFLPATNSQDEQHDAHVRSLERVEREHRIWPPYGEKPGDVGYDPRNAERRLVATEASEVLAEVDALVGDHDDVDALASNLPVLPVPDEAAPIRTRLWWLIRRWWRGWCERRRVRIAVVSIEREAVPPKGSRDVPCKRAPASDSVREARAIVERTATNPVRRILDALDDKSFDAGKLDALRFMLGNTRLTVRDAAEILAAFSFDSARIEALRRMRPNITDPENWQDLLGEFSFDSHRRRARELAPHVRPPKPGRRRD